MLNTETPSSQHVDLDLYPTGSLVSALIEDQSRAAAAVAAAAPALARVVDAAAPRLGAGGRLLYVGAGTSGRLGVLDSVELLPTFSWPSDRSIAVMAGGLSAVFTAVEGAEDDAAQGAADLRAHVPGPNDVVLLLAASGQTPYVLGALDVARAAGALTVGIANNPESPLATRAEIGVTLDTGSEVISGSTRLKAGTAQKIALNVLSSAIMVRLHKVYGNLMVDVMPTNVKLRRRALALVQRAAATDEAAATQALAACGGHVKTAIVMLRGGWSADEARQRLATVDGSVRAAIAQRG
jgi:N-acetylmuramic acid 6-phosphate etherase